MASYYLIEALHLSQAALSAWGVVNSLIAIKNLRQHEDTSEKAAKISSTAAEQLHKTRTTQASGLVGTGTCDAALKGGRRSSGLGDSRVACQAQQQELCSGGG
ncbi:hypothetical protein ANO11243_083200 [Dothideomycetidae sp. 11243]|nr:hypothetical protein ANO11243_083200 [fungal sp. No.11243]